ncbi:hypothetical protein [Streptomyces sp. CT34]|uniref:hypothetical protein n=1 Tax=Streptomyces sp. CT34 TaxID=1553907 RepID=UPI0005BDF328|nr:hypothetical protein [Streptomyces sp. CT34]
MNSTPKMTQEQELAAAVAIVRVGLDRIRDAATRTEDVAPHIASLRALYDHRDPEAGVLAAIADVIGTITVSLTEVGHTDSESAVELLDEAQAYAQDSTGDRIYRALEKLAPLLVCKECGQQKDGVKVMPDPFTENLDPDRDDHELMPLCADCATARFEES